MTWLVKIFNYLYLEEDRNALTFLFLYLIFSVTDLHYNKVSVFWLRRLHLTNGRTQLLFVNSIEGAGKHNC